MLLIYFFLHRIVMQLFKRNENFIKLELKNLETSDQMISQKKYWYAIVIFRSETKYFSFIQFCNHLQSDEQ